MLNPLLCQRDHPDRRRGRHGPLTDPLCAAAVPRARGRLQRGTVGRDHAAVRAARVPRDADPAAPARQGRLPDPGDHGAAAVLHELHARHRPHRPKRRTRLRVVATDPRRRADARDDAAQPGVDGRRRARGLRRRRRPLQHGAQSRRLDRARDHRHRDRPAHRLPCRDAARIGQRQFAARPGPARGQRRRLVRADRRPRLRANARAGPVRRADPAAGTRDDVFGNLLPARSRVARLRAARAAAEDPALPGVARRRRRDSRMP